jgi:hypothetical protein
MTDLRTVSIPVSCAIAIMAGCALMWYGASLLTVGGIALMLLGLTMAVTAFVTATIAGDEQLAGSPIHPHQADPRPTLRRR